MWNENPGLDQVRVPKVQLLDQLRKNRDAHRALFEEAMEGYRTRSIEILEEHIERIKSGKPEKVAVALPMPEDHTSEYDQVIEMVEWSMDDEVWLTSHQFSQYVRDDWSWKQQFLTSAAAYGVTT